MERTAFEAPPRVGHGFVTQEAGASAGLRPQAEPENEYQPGLAPSGSWTNYDRLTCFGMRCVSGTSLRQFGNLLMQLGNRERFAFDFVETNGVYQVSAAD